MANNYLSVYHHNIRGIRSKLDQLNMFLKEEKPDVFCFNETYLKPSFKLQLENYDIIRKDRVWARMGGVMIAIKKQIAYIEIKNLIPDGVHDTEVVAIKLIKENVTIASIYHPKGNPSEVVYDNLIKSDNNLIIQGDLNGKISTYGSSVTNNSGKKIISIIDKLNLTVLNSGDPTHQNDATGALDVIDYSIISNNLTRFDNHMAVSDEDLGSDHFILKSWFKISFDNYTSNKNVILSLHHKVNWDEQGNLLKNKFDTFKNNHQQLPYNKEYIDNMTNFITQEIQDIISRIPKKEIPLNSIGLPKHVVSKIKEKRKMRRNYNISRDPKLKSDLNKIKNEIKKEIKQFKINQWAHDCNSVKLDSKRNWSKTKSMIGKQNKQKSIPILKDNTSTANSDQEKAEMFVNNLEKTFCHNDPPNKYNDTFKNDVEQFIDINDNLFNPISANKLEFPIEPISDIYKEITLKEIEECINNLSIKKAKGEDGIGNKVIISLKEYLIPILHHIFNLSLLIGYIPQKWKTAQLIMIFKENKPINNPGSYRPISLTSCLGKILEKTITKRLYKWCEDRNIINKEQSGFRSGHSTNEQLFNITQYIKDGFNRNQKTIAIFLDMEKAFDRVWHAGLKFKLRLLGLPDGILRWISSFLSDRKMRVFVNGKLSRDINPSFGVPQGSPISPLLFILFVTDIAVNIKDTKISQFADDIALYYSNKIFEQSVLNLQRNLNKLDIWCKTWRMGLNPSKSKIIIFNHRLKRQLPSPLNLKLQNTDITVFSEAKFLGITFDNRLNFKKHIEEITKEVRKTYFYILSLKSRNYGPTNKVMIQLFKTFIRSKMEYGSPCLITVPKNLLSSWESLQTDLIKHMFNFSTYINHNIIRQSANLPTIYDRLLYLARKWLDNIKVNNPDFASSLLSITRRNNIKTPIEIING